MDIHEINKQIENLLQKLRHLNEMFFNVDKEYSYKLREEKIKIEKEIERLKFKKKYYLIKK